jgi:polyhydroxyalkanoate synthesis regulator phasin
MTEDESDSSSKSWKEKWSSLSARGSLLTKDVGKLLSEKGKRISEASMDAASQAKESLEEARQRRLLDKMARDVDEILAETENTPADEKEVERLRLLVATLEIRQKEQEALIEEMNNLADEAPGEGPPSDVKSLGFVATIRQTYALIGFAVLWALMLVVIARFVEKNDMMVLDQPAEPFFWIIGTMIWAYVVISQLSRAGSFEKLPMSFRIQATIGVGVATSATSLLPEIEQMPAMFHIFSWLVIVSLSILLLSSVLNGFRSIRDR